MTPRAAFFVIVLLVLVVLVAHVFACERSGDGFVGGSAERYTHLLKPAGRGPHTHLAALGAEGDGTSTTNYGHRHAVRAYTAAPGPDGHVHDITQYIVSK
jgi:hypothetical protein